VLIVSAHDGYPRHLNSGADFIEVDIRRTQQGVIVLAHDVLRPSGRYTTLDEVLDAACGKIGLQLDLKEAGYEVELVRSALEKCAPDRIVVTTDRAESLRKIKAQFPEVRTGLTSRHVQPTDADFFALDERYATDADLNNAPIPVWVWTVDDRRQMQRLIQEVKVAGIITNRPDRALKLRPARS
jgi:glycerophosphoryl diester phosphodiesterase